MVELLSSDPELTIVHQCGSLDFEAVQRAAEALPPRLAARYTASAFFDDMAARIALRATSSSCAQADRQSRNARRWDGR